MTADALRLAEGYVQVKSLGPVNVKGLTEPVEVYEVTGAGAARSRLQAAAARGLTRFVGRDAEIEQLRKALEQARAAMVRWSRVVGEPGVGKSRLFFEFTHSHRTAGMVDPRKRFGFIWQGHSLSTRDRSAQSLFQNSGPRRSARRFARRSPASCSHWINLWSPTLPAFLALLDVPVDDPAVAGTRSAPTPSAAPWTRSSGCCFERVRSSLCSWYSRICTGSTPRPRRCWRAWWKVCRRAGCSFWSTIVRNTSMVGASKTYYTQLRIDPLPPESAEEFFNSVAGE